MKVYVINFHHVLNYGAVFQGYALCRFIEQQGYDVKLIDYRPYYLLFNTYKPAKGLLKSYRKIVMNLNFLRFRKTHFKLTKKAIFTEKGLRDFFKDSDDAFICGSDQVWNAQLTNGRLDPGYFLDFVPSTARKIAYAASIGHTKFDGFNEKDIAQRLATYSAISVREDFARDQVDQISNGEIVPTLVLDPTLILDDYSEVLDFSLVPDYEYIVVYTTEDSDQFRLYAEQVSRELGMTLFNLGHYKLNGRAKEYTNIPPSQWLGLFAKANYVCTNSFHGTAFSIVFKRNFTVLGRTSKKRLNTRQLTLLSSLGLRDRFIEDFNDFDVANHLSDISYDKVSARLRAEQERSWEFLLNALQMR